MAINKLALLATTVAVFAGSAAAHWNPPTPPTPPGGYGDPMFLGLDGRMFYFDGILNMVSNLLSEQDHQLNALFSPGPHKIDALGKKTDGTFMTAFGLQMFNTKVEMHVDEEGETTILVNGVNTTSLLNEKNDFSLKFDEPNSVSITVEKYRPNYGSTVVARSPLLELILFSTPKQYDPVVKEVARGHLNFEMGVNPEGLKLTSLHGILGQNTHARSTDTALLPAELATIFLGEGEDKDYVVTGIFGTDFKYNLFGQQRIVKAGSGEFNPAPLKISSSRKMLDNGVSYVLAAKMGSL